MPHTSCPRCGTEAPAQAARCPACGFGFLESGERRPGARPGPRAKAIALVAACALVVAAAVLLPGRDEPAAAPKPPAPVSARTAEERLERQAVKAGYEDTATVRCGRPVELGRDTRCYVIYANGDTQLILVALDRSGDFYITVPYPAQRRREY
jgi:hypothetical protein